MATATPHKNKTVTTLLAAVLGGIGLHRFYLHGLRDRFGWLHVLSVPLSLALAQAFPATPALFTALPLVLSMLCAALEALVIGLTPDEKWDLRHNTASAHQSESHWILAVILVLTAGAGAMGAIALLARSFDLLLPVGRSDNRRPDGFPARRGHDQNWSSSSASTDSAPSTIAVR